MRRALIVLLSTLAACGAPPSEAPTIAAEEVEANVAPSADPIDPKLDDDPAPQPLPGDPPPPVPPLPEPPPHPARYPSNRTHSPITHYVATRLQQIAKIPRAENVFAKIGDSITETSANLACFTGAYVDLAAHAALEPTRTFFAAGDAAGASPFARKSLAAKIGWSAIGPLQGTPSYLDRELSALTPRYAFLMFGTNDVETHQPFVFGERMLTIVDALIAEGTIPLMSTIPPRDDDPALDVEVPRFNAIVRGIAEARQIPLIDYHRELMPLAGHGLAGDQVHPRSYQVAAGYRPCVLDASGLANGYNVRNLVSLGALARAKDALAGVALDPPGPALAGDGSAAQPFAIEALPFADMRETNTNGAALIDHYTGCNAAQDESGREIYYRFVATATTHVRAMVIDRTGVDVDLHLLDTAPSADRCVTRHDRVIDATLEPGTYYFVLDTFVANGAAQAGEYLFVLL